MKTAMQELLELCKNYQATFQNPIGKIVEKIEGELLEKEKEQIEVAHIEGQRVFDDYPHTQWTNDQAELYYNKTYKQ